MQADSRALPRSEGKARQMPTGEDRGFFLFLVGAALISRVVWVLWVHPPADYLSSDMARYLERASTLLHHGVQPGMRTMAWQAWGTHWLMAGLMQVFGDSRPWTGIALFWGLCSAGTAIWTYRLARAWWGVGKRTRLVGVIALLWFPHLSSAGFFLSEPPFTFALLVASLAMVRALDQGRTRDAAIAAVASAVVFALRPQSLVFFVLLALFLLWQRKRFPLVRGHGLLVAASLALMLALSMWRFSIYTGSFGGIAENATMNLSAARCHNVVTQAFTTQEALDRSQARGNSSDGRRVSLPGFRMLASTGDGHPLALRPALGGESVRVLGYIGDAEVHRELRQRCYAATGGFEQLRYTVVNLSLLWVLNYQWPEVADFNAPMGQWYLAQVFVWIFVIVFWLPSMVGAFQALRRREHAVPVFCALALLSIIVVAALFFGTIRLRTPYDPYALILALPVLEVWWAKWRARGS